jgi:hypothetical protein
MLMLLLLLFFLFFLDIAVYFNCIQEWKCSYEEVKSVIVALSSVHRRLLKYLYSLCHQAWLNL